MTSKFRLHVSSFVRRTLPGGVCQERGLSHRLNRQMGGWQRELNRMAPTKKVSNEFLGYLESCPIASHYATDRLWHADSRMHYKLLGEKFSPNQSGRTGDLHCPLIHQGRLLNFGAGINRRQVKPLSPILPLIWPTKLRNATKQRRKQKLLAIVMQVARRRALFRIKSWPQP